MTKKYWIYRDRKVRKNYRNTEINKLVLKSLLANKLYPVADKVYWSFLFNKYGKRNCISFYRRGCMWTGTGRSVFKTFKASRHVLKKNAALGYLPGIRKSSF